MQVQDNSGDTNLSKLYQALLTPDQQRSYMQAQQTEGTVNLVPQSHCLAITHGTNFVFCLKVRW